MSTTLQHLRERERRLVAQLIALGTPARMDGAELRRRNKLVAQLNALRTTIFQHRQLRLGDRLRGAAEGANRKSGW